MHCVTASPSSWRTGTAICSPWLAWSKRYRLVTIASLSKDGRIMGTLLRLLGARISAGSSTSCGGAAALKGLIRLMREGHNCSFAVELSDLLRQRQLRSRVSLAPLVGDRAYVPKPFARIDVQWRGPLPAVGRHDDARDPQLLARLEELMLQAKRDGHVPGQQALP